MSRCVVLISLLVLPAVLLAEDPPKTSEADTHDKVVGDMLKVLKSAAKAFSGVNDAESAAKAKPGLEQLAGEMNKLNERITKLGPPTKDQEAALEKKFKQELDDTLKSYAKEVQRLMKDSFGKELIAVFEKKPAPKPAEKKDK